MTDFRLEQWINGPAGSHPAWDSAMKALANGAELIFLAIVAAWFLVGLGRRRTADLVGAVAALIAAALALAVNQVIGLFWTRPRPFVAHPGAVHVLASHAADASFPSDHAAAAFAIAAVLVVLHRRVGIAALVLATAVAYARVYVGDHYPGDVAAGALIGIVSAVVVVRLLHRHVTAAVSAVMPRLPRGAGWGGAR
jgi:undecaprenyl-diphosphatase